jgi:hypothetical protein
MGLTDVNFRRVQHPRSVDGKFSKKSVEDTSLFGGQPDHTTYLMVLKKICRNHYALCRVCR